MAMIAVPFRRRLSLSAARPAVAQRNSPHSIPLEMRHTAMAHLLLEAAPMVPPRPQYTGPIVLSAKPLFMQVLCRMQKEAVVL